MVIQRLQNLWLLCAFICAGATFFFPWFYADGTADSAPVDYIMIILAGLATILPLLGIFMFKNLRRQKLVSTIAFMMAATSVVYAMLATHFGLHFEAQSLTKLGAAVFIMMPSGIFDLLAHSAAARDERLLRSADRLR